MSDLSDSIIALALAIHRLAATQEPIVISQSKSPVSFSVAHFEDQPDDQTANLREMEKQLPRDL